MSVQRSIVRCVAVVVGAFVLAGCQQWAQSRADAALTGHNAHETAISLGNVDELDAAFGAPIGGPFVATTAVAPPVVAGGRVFVAHDGALRAMDAAGEDGCQPSTTDVRYCDPLWTAPLDSPAQAPAAAYGTVYVVTSGEVDVGTGEVVGGRLSAFDAEGLVGCGNDPPVCDPLWTADVASNAPPTVARNRVFVSDARTGRLLTFDAAGSEGCGGAPKVCEPLWRSGTEVAHQPAVAGDRVFVAGTVTTGDAPLMGFDLTGGSGCAGDPVVCLPVWSGRLAGSDRWLGSPSVADGRVSGVGRGGVLAVFDAAGVEACPGGPTECVPLGTAGGAGVVGRLLGTPSVADGVLYVAWRESGFFFRGGIVAYDRDQVESCDGEPEDCAPLWTGWPTVTSTHASDVDPTSPVYPLSSPSVANGVVFAGMLGVDAWAADGCGAAACSPLWHAPVENAPVEPGFFDWVGEPLGAAIAAESPAVAGGRVFVTGSRQALIVYELP